VGSQGSQHKIQNKKENKNKETISNDIEKKEMSIVLYPYNGRFDEAPDP
jgi:hypothetical protein